jgi:hypothetical protein
LAFIPYRSPDVWFNEAHESGFGVELELMAVTRALAALPMLPESVVLSIKAGPETVVAPGFHVAFGALDRARGVVLAGLAGLALGLAEAREEEVRRADNLRQALVTRELIGQAQGILMERERITAEQAFEILRAASQNLNTKLREVAQDLVETGERPQAKLSRAQPKAG